MFKLNVTGSLSVALDRKPRSPVDWSRKLDTTVALQIGIVPAVAVNVFTWSPHGVGDLAVQVVANVIECGSLPMATKLLSEFRNRLFVDNGFCRISFIPCCSVLAILHAARFTGRLCPKIWATMKLGTHLWHSWTQIVGRTPRLVKLPSVSQHASRHGT